VDEEDDWADEEDDWTDDPATMAKALAELGSVEARLTLVEPAERVKLLRSLGREAEALDDAQLITPDPDLKPDAWRIFMLTADDCVRKRDWDAAEKMHWHAWRYVHSRNRQGTSMQHIGLRLWHYGDRDSAAAFLEVARALRHGFAEPGLLASTETVLAEVRAATGYDAIVLAGGRGSRLGGGKQEQRLAGWPLLDHVLLAVSAASTRIVVGPVRRGLGEPVFVQEQPAGSGPVAGIAAAIDQVTEPLVAVLAADLPFIRDGLDQFRALLHVAPEKDAAVLVDTGGRINYLASMWRTSSLRRALAALGDPAGLPVRALYESVDAIHVPDFDSLSADVDTPNDLAAAEARLMRPQGRFPLIKTDQPPATPLLWPGLELHSPS
jgi:molybdopterin-guanine dinucleotide biosynthesis protein A